MQNPGERPSSDIVNSCKIPLQNQGRNSDLNKPDSKNDLNKPDSKNDLIKPDNKNDLIKPDSKNDLIKPDNNDDPNKRNRKVAFHTLGCKVNRYETDAVAQTFVAAGYQVLAFDETADVYVINTCTVTGEADRKSRQFLRQAKKRNPAALVVAMGCHVELSDASSYADILVGNKDKIKVIELVEREWEQEQAQTIKTGIVIKDNLCDTQGGIDSKRTDYETIKIKKTDKNNREETFYSTVSNENTISERTMGANQSIEFEEMGLVTSLEETRAYIKIEDGCNNFCSYCAIPLARGRVRSREEQAVLREAEALARKGFREIVLTGIHVCSYGTDRGQRSDALIDLVERLSKIKGLGRIRLGSLEPQSLTPLFIKKASTIKALCPHFHLSLQSGSDTVLKRMNRRYTTGEYAQIVANIRKHFPDATITTDIITGFPGETAKEHEETLQFCSAMNFLDMHIFKFSERKGTKAALMKEKIVPATISQRSKDLILLAQEMRIAHFRASIGKKCEVLVEKMEGTVATGYTRNYMPASILVENPKCKAGEIISVEMDSYDEEMIFAHIVIPES